MIAAPDRESLIARHALPRPRAAVAPVRRAQLASGKELRRLLEPLRAARPRAPSYAPVAFDTWWVDEAKDKALQRGEKK